MKKRDVILSRLLISWIIYVVIVSAQPITASTQYQYAENFDAFSNGTVIGQRGWNTYNAGNAMILLENERGKVLKVQRPSDNEPENRGVRVGVGNSLAKEGNYVVFECDFKIMKGNTTAITEFLNIADNGVQIYNTTYDSDTGLVQVNWKGNEKIIENEWNELRIVVDLSPGVGSRASASAYLNNVLIAEDISACNNFRSGVSNALILIQNATCDAEIYFDSLRVSRGDNKTATTAKQEVQASSAPQQLEEAVVLLLGESKALVKNNQTSIDVNNADVVPFVQDGRTLVPVRFISESLGADVDWEASTSTITVNLDGKTIKMVLGSTIYTVNGEQQILDISAQTVNDRTMIPLRAMAEALGKKVFWDDRGLIIISDVQEILNKDQDEALIVQVLQLLKNN